MSAAILPDTPRNRVSSGTPRLVELTHKTGRHQEEHKTRLRIKWRSEMSVAWLCPALGNPMDCSPPGSSVYGIPQARILEWVAIPFSRGSSPPRDGTWVSCVIGRFFTIWATRDSVVKNPPANARAWVWSLNQEDPLAEGMATHSSILAWGMSWTEGLVGYSISDNKRVGNNLEAKQEQKNQSPNKAGKRFFLDLCPCLLSERSWELSFKAWLLPSLQYYRFQT